MRVDYSDRLTRGGGMKELSYFNSGLSPVAFCSGPGAEFRLGQSPRGLRKAHRLMAVFCQERVVLASS
jgi:hypothetical protein